MFKTISRNKWLIAGTALLIAVFFWYSLSGQGAQSTSAVTTKTVTTSSESNIVSTLLQLKAITLSGAIFSDPVFNSLKDIDTGIVPEPVGRPNPFAPLSAPAQVAAAAAATTQQQQPPQQTPAKFKPK